MKAIISLFVLLLSVTSGLACTCVRWEGMPEKDRDKYLEELDAIFEGEVVSLGEKRSTLVGLGGGRKYEEVVQNVQLKVLRTWKGLDTTEITVETDAGSSCQFIPTVGSAYVVYASRRNGSLFMNYCSVGQFDDKTLRLKYGQGKLIEHPKPAPAIDEKPESFLYAVWKRIISWFS